MKRGKNLWRVSALSIVCTILLVACGGGGGSSSGGGDNFGGISYQGESSPAEINAQNAGEIAVAAYQSGTSAENLAVFSATRANLTEEEPILVPRLLSMSETLKEAMLSIKTDEIQETNLAASVSQSIDGRFSGRAEFTQSSDTSGTISFSNYSDDGATFINGRVGFTLNMDSTNQLQSFSMTFSSLSTKTRGEDFEYSGSMAFHFGSSASTMTLDMLSRDQASGKIYKIENYEIALGTDGSIRISGKFYNPDFGYVTLDTLVPLISYGADAWPTQGELLCTGRNGWVKLVFVPAVANGSADTDGDDMADLFFTYDPIAAPGEEITYENTGNTGNENLNRIFLSTEVTDPTGAPLNVPIDLKENPSFNLKFKVKQSNGTNVELRYLNKMGAINCGNSFSSAGGCNQEGSFECDIQSTLSGDALVCRNSAGIPSTHAIMSSSFALTLTARDYTTNPLSAEEEEVSFNFLY